jgi:hypothetical protein
MDAPLGTGLPGLDRVLTGLLPGDNVVWHVSSVDDYRTFVEPYCEKAAAHGQRVVYFRFSKHAPLVAPGPNVEVLELHPQLGLEAFIAEIHGTIERVGPGGWFVFDLLSDLADLWHSDRMLSNFFLLTCPYLYDVGAVAYFSLLRDYHASETITTICDTAQVSLDVFRHKQELYVHPLKVQQRHSPTMYMLHAWRGGDVLPVASSATTAEIRTSAPWAGSDIHYPTGVWARALQQAEGMLAAIQRGERKPEDGRVIFERSLQMVLSRDERVLSLARKYLTLPDLVAIQERVIGSGLIGGKAVGMLLANAILRQTDPKWAGVLESHDSFFIGSDVFYSFVVRNGLWWVREKQKDPASFLDGADRARQRMLVGDFPPQIIKQFADMLDYFGQSPIIVRSSSLLEDAFGNSFAGKYESIFCANQGSRHKRLEDFLSAARTVYASTMSARALSYRAQRGILDRDEQMGLLVQRVSGCMHDTFFYPHVAGVALSYNPYVWSSYIRPEDGVLRLVFGLGTRAVDRCDDDYTRVVALAAPERRVESSFDEVREYAQRRVDVIDLNANRLVSYDFPEVIRRSKGLQLDTVASVAPGSPTPPQPEHWVLTFEHLLTRTPFVEQMREIVRTLKDAYEYPVDVEFTANFTPDTGCRINVVQCRPLQVKGGGAMLEPPPPTAREDVVLEAHGAVIGHSRRESVDRFVYVVPSVYGLLPLQKRYAVARLIGRVLHAEEPRKPQTTFLIGPGRWGTTTPSLDIPITFAEINTIAAVCEVAAMHDGLVPDVSLGTHFFNELVEMDILYLALAPDSKQNLLNNDFFMRAPNRLLDLAPGADDMASIVRVVNAADLPGQLRVWLHADMIEQSVLCYLDRGPQP